MKDLANGWVLTNEEPYYFISKVKDTENTYKGISLFIVDDGICAEKHKIKYDDIPLELVADYKDDVDFKGEDFKKFIVECAFTEGYGETFDKEFFEKNDIEEIDTYLREEGIEYKICKDSFL